MSNFLEILLVALSLNCLIAKTAILFHSFKNPCQLPNMEVALCNMTADLCNMTPPQRGGGEGGGGVLVPLFPSKILIDFSTDCNFKRPTNCCFLLPIKINCRSNTTISWDGSTFVIRGFGPKARQRQKPPKAMGTCSPGSFENYVLRNAISSILSDNCKMFISLKSSEFRAN